MARNIGYLTSNRTIEGDETYTPPYAVNAIAKYIPNSIKVREDGISKITRILCPFDKDEHAFPSVFKALGYEVVNTHYDPETGVGRDFFTYTKDEVKSLGIDYLVSNPPFSTKDLVLERCEELDIPYALLLPLPTLQSNRRYKKVFSNGKTQALIFAERIGYSTREKSWEEIGMTNHFGSIFICKDVLPQALIFDSLKYPSI
jgi:hypothetical protein